MVKKAGLKNTPLFTFTNLRKHVATLSQALNITPSEQDQLATFMGHDLNIHKKYYRHPIDVVQRAKVAKILIAVNRGMNVYEDKVDLEDLNIDEEPEKGPDDLPEEVPDEQLEKQPKAKEKRPPTSDALEQERPAKRANTVPKTCWSEAEASAVRRALNHRIKMNKTPNMKDCNEAKAKEPVLASRDWQSIKWYAYNLIQNIRRKKSKEKQKKE